MASTLKIWEQILYQMAPILVGLFQKKMLPFVQNGEKHVYPLARKEQKFSQEQPPLVLRMTFERSKYYSVKVSNLDCLIGRPVFNILSTLRVDPTTNEGINGNGRVASSESRPIHLATYPFYKQWAFPNTKINESTSRYLILLGLTTL